MREEHREKNAERFGIEEDPCSTQTSQTLDTGEWNKVTKNFFSHFLLFVTLKQSVGAMEQKTHSCFNHSPSAVTAA